ncbi:MAG: hypothetical protein NT027_17395, partial [Proteobacteria bacterium]|nr:hypothetical protein [Pseudomonadota bacterium]
IFNRSISASYPIFFISKHKNFEGGLQDIDLSPLAFCRYIRAGYMGSICGLGRRQSFNLKSMPFNAKIVFVRKSTGPKNTKNYMEDLVLR